jgi:hypothetical protein
MFKSLDQGSCAEVIETKLDALLRYRIENDQGTTWYTFDKLKWLKCNLSLILSIDVLYYQKGCIILYFGLVSVLK